MKRKLPDGAPPIVRERGVRMLRWPVRVGAQTFSWVPLGLVSRVSSLSVDIDNTAREPIGLRWFIASMDSQVTPPSVAGQTPVLPIVYFSGGMQVDGFDGFVGNDCTSQLSATVAAAIGGAADVLGVPTRMPFALPPDLFVSPNERLGIELIAAGGTITPTITQACATFMIP